MPLLMEPPTPFAKRMREAREAAGLRLDESSVEARRLMGASFGPSRETIRRYESGMISEDRADPIVVAALAEVYDVSVGYLSRTVANQVRSLSSLMRRNMRRPGLDALEVDDDAPFHYPSRESLDRVQAIIEKMKAGRKLTKKEEEDLEDHFRRP